MAQSNKERRIVFTVITANAVVSLLSLLAMVYLFTQVSHLQEENANLRGKVHKLQAIDKRNGERNTDTKKKDETFGSKCCGVRGKRGRPGVKGDPGLKGEDGRDGTHGRTGSPGKPGVKGEKGSTGSPGVKGDQGICPSCENNLMPNTKDLPLIRLIGDGKQLQKINNVDATAVPFWKVTDKVGNISYSKGRVTTNVEGYYQIYSQMAYCGRGNLTLGHYMKINGKRVLQSEVTNGTHNLNSIVKLKKGDTISVEPRVTNIEYCFSRQEAFFGVVFIRK